MSTCDIRYTCMYIRVYIYIHICIYISRCIRDVQMKSKFRRMKILTLTNTYIYTIYILYIIYHLSYIIYYILYISYLWIIYIVYTAYIYTYMCLSILHLLPLHALLTCSNRCSMCRDISCRASVRRGCSLSLQCGFLSGKRACMT